MIPVPFRLFDPGEPPVVMPDRHMDTRIPHFMYCTYDRTPCPRRSSSIGISETCGYIGSILEAHRINSQISLTTIRSVMNAISANTATMLSANSFSRGGICSEIFSILTFPPVLMSQTQTSRKQWFYARSLYYIIV